MRRVIRHRVLIVMPALPPWHFSGGTPRLYKWCEILPELGWDVSVSGFSGNTARHDPLPAEVSVYAVNNNRIVDRIASRLFRLASRREIGANQSQPSENRLTRRVIQAIEEFRPDIVMVTGALEHSRLLKAISAAAPRRLVLDIRDYYLNRSAYMEPALSSEELERRKGVLRYAMRLVSGVSAVYDGILEECRGSEFDGPMALVPNAFQESSLAAPRANWPGRERQQFLLSYVGMLTGPTRLSVLVPAVKLAVARDPNLLEHIQVLLVGQAKQEFVGDWTGDLNGVLSQHSHVTYTKAKQIMRESDVLLMPRPDTGLSQFLPGGKMYEYMGARRPVLAISHGAPAQLTRECQIGLTAPPDDPEAVADAILKLFGMWQRNEPFPFGPESLIDPYEVTHSAKALIGLFEQVLQRAQKN